MNRNAAVSKFARRRGNCRIPNSRKIRLTTKSPSWRHHLTEATTPTASPKAIRTDTWRFSSNKSIADRANRTNTSNDYTDADSIQTVLDLRSGGRTKARLQRYRRLHASSWLRRQPPAMPDVQDVDRITLNREQNPVNVWLAATQ